MRESIDFNFENSSRELVIFANISRKYDEINIFDIDEEEDISKDI